MTARRADHLEPQVDSCQYVSEAYCQPPRFASYAYQIREVLRTCPSNVLEIGPGNGLVTFVLRGAGIAVTTMDIDPALKPDVVAPVQDMPFSEPEFDTVLCCEVLEHLPWDDLVEALRSIRSVSRRYAVISVPDTTPRYYLEVRLPWLGTRRLGLDVPRNGPRVLCDEHYWEIGRTGATLSAVEAAMRDAGWLLLKSYRARENALHRFFLLEKQSS